MLIVNIVTAVCLAGLLAELLYFVIALAVKKRAERISFIRGFKKGSCVIVYLITLPLFFLGYWYAGDGVLNSLFEAISDIVYLVILNYNLTGISLLLSSNLFYSIVVYTSFILVALNAILFTLSIAGQRLWCFYRSIVFKFSLNDRLYIFGCNENNVNIFKSDKDSCKIIIGDINAEKALELYSDKITYLSAKKYLGIIKNAVKKSKRLNYKTTIVINTMDDTLNMYLCRAFADGLSNFDAQTKKQVLQKLRIYVFGDSRYETIYNDIVTDSVGAINYVNKYRKIAVDFVDKYPFTKFMDERHIDYSTALVKKDTEINVLMIGFGNTNRQIFMTSVANNQFLKQGKNSIELQKVKYAIFDKVDSKNNKNLNHDYYRFKNEMEDFYQDEYLPLPSLPAHEDYYKLDINDNNFYKSIRSIISRNSLDVNIAIIAFGTDLENIDMAQKLIQKRAEWGIDNLKIFVKARSWNKEDSFLEQKDCFFIGNEKDVVYNIEKITNDKIFRMALMRNQLYNIENTLSISDKNTAQKTVEEILIKANEDWYLKTQLERESSTYCCLSLKSKLNMMGLTYVQENEDGQPLTESEYINIYAKNDLPVVERSQDGKKLVRYSLDFPDSLRKNLAIQEHQRWNSFMISKGLIPASIKQILEETMVLENGKLKHTNGKNYKLRRHGNITTLEGLITFRKLIAKRDNVAEDLTDVFKYDYQLMDDAYELLKVNGYKIIKI